MFSQNRLYSMPKYKSQSQLILIRTIKILALFLFCLVIFHSPATASKPPEPFAFSSLLERPSLFQTGDLIFRKGIGPGSRFVDMVDEGSQFSHVGLIQKDADSITVIHAMPETADGAGWVRRQPLADFLADSTEIAVYRLQPEARQYVKTAVQEMTPWIDTIPFDKAFSLDSADSLYCTELIWLAFERAGLDLVDGEFDELDMPLAFEGLFLLPSRLANSRYLQEMFHFP